MRFSRQEYLSGLLFPSPGEDPNAGIEPRSPALPVNSLPSEPLGKYQDAHSMPKSPVMNNLSMFLLTSHNIQEVAKVSLFDRLFTIVSLFLLE